MSSKVYLSRKQARQLEDLIASMRAELERSDTE